MKLNLLAAAAAATLFAAPALAQEVPAPDRTEGEITFTGFRIEGRVGYSHQDVKLFSRDLADQYDFDNSLGTDSVQVGVGGGYDFDFGGLVLGVEAGVDWSLGESKAELSDVTFPTTSLDLDFGRDIEVGGRLGLRVGNNLLVYGKGGYTNLNVSAKGVGQFTDPATGQVTLVDLRNDRNLDGWRIGGGAELALPAGFLGGAAYAKAEFRYSDYSQDISKQEALLGIGFRF